MTTVTSKTFNTTTLFLSIPVLDGSKPAIGPVESAKCRIRCGFCTDSAFCDLTCSSSRVAAFRAVGHLVLVVSLLQISEGLPPQRPGASGPEVGTQSRSFVYGRESYISRWSTIAAEIEVEFTSSVVFWPSRTVEFSRRGALKTCAQVNDNID